MNIYLQNKRLPTEYQEVEYIENNGTAYILSGLNIKDGYRNQMKVRFLAAAYADSYHGISGGYLGPDNGLPGGQARFYLNGLQTNGRLNYGYLENWGDIGSGLSTGIDYEIDYSWISGNAFVKLNGNTLQSSSATYSTSLQGQAPVGGAAHMDLNQYRANPGIRIYYSKFYNSAGTLVRDFVPCYRKSDNVIGMYDLVNSVFYTNSGTGTFSKGNDVIMTELKNAYIGDYKRRIECDFTESDYGFVFNSRTATDITYGRDSNGLYCTRPLDLGACAWKIPSSIYSRGTIKKIEIELYSESIRNGGGISYGADTYVSRIRANVIESGRGSGVSSATVGNAPSGGYTFTLDLENKIASCSYTSTTLSLSDSDITTIRNYWSGGNLNICSMVWSANTYSYIKKATFYF